MNKQKVSEVFSSRRPGSLPVSQISKCRLLCQATEAANGLSHGWRILPQSLSSYRRVDGRHKWKKTGLLNINAPRLPRDQPDSLRQTDGGKCAEWHHAVERTAFIPAEVFPPRARRTRQTWKTQDRAWLIRGVKTAACPLPRRILNPNKRVSHLEALWIQSPFSKMPSHSIRNQSWNLSLCIWQLARVLPHSSGFFFLGETMENIVVAHV